MRALVKRTMAKEICEQVELDEVIKILEESRDIPGTPERTRKRLTMAVRNLKVLRAIGH
jgi:hypothetical protein